MSKVSLKDAIAQLQVMFPDFDEEVLKTMIFQTKGHLEKTIELLLQIENQSGVKKEPSVENRDVKNDNSVKHNLPNDLLMYRPNVIQNSIPKQTPVQKRASNTQPGIQSQQQSAPEAPSTFEMLSEFAKKKFSEFQSKFKSTPTNTPFQQQYTSLLRDDDSDEEEHDKKRK